MIHLALFAPYFTRLGPPAFRRWLLDRFVPVRKLQTVKEIVDTMDRQSRIVFAAKKRALEEGDDAVARQVGEGRDVLSILSACIFFSSVSLDRVLDCADALASWVRSAREHEDGSERAAGRGGAHRADVVRSPLPSLAPIGTTG